MELLNEDCLQWLKARKEDVKCIFADIPDNIGLQYDGYNDNQPDYYFWVRRLVDLSMSVGEIFWLSYNSIHDLEISYIVRSVLPIRWEWKKIIWRYTFGQYNDKDIDSGYRPILMLRRNGCIVYPDRIREESERMRIGDIRNCGPRIPDLVWDFPRVVGNSIERRDWIKTQHPVVLYDRIMKYSCGVGETFVDLCAGSGTCFRAGLLNQGTDVIGIEISKTYCNKIKAAGLVG